MNAQYIRDYVSGISKDHRELLSRLHRDHPTPFGIDEAKVTLELPRPKVRSLLRYWCARGWLSRIRRGIYYRASQRQKSIRVAGGCLDRC